MALTIQYVIIAIVFIIAVGFIVKKFLPSKSDNIGCGKSCGCAHTKVTQSKA